MKVLIKGLIIILVFVVPGFLSLLVTDVPFSNQPSFKSSQKIFKDEQVFQLFESGINRLSGIGVSLRNPNLKETNDVTLTLYDDKNNLLRKVTINGKFIPDGGFVKFKFEPVENSLGKRYVFVLSVPTSLSDHNLEVYKTDSGTKGAELLIDKKRDTQNIAFVQFDKITDHKKMVIETYKNWWINLINDLPFVALYGLSVLTLAGYLVYKSS